MMADQCIRIGCKETPHPGSHFCLHDAYLYVTMQLVLTPPQEEALKDGPEMFKQEYGKNRRPWWWQFPDWFVLERRRVRDYYGNKYKPAKFDGVFCFGGSLDTQHIYNHCDRCDRILVSTAVRCGFCQKEHGVKLPEEPGATVICQNRGRSFSVGCEGRISTTRAREAKTHDQLTLTVCPNCSVNIMHMAYIMRKTKGA
jgi:hypothetical protein